MAKKTSRKTAKKTRRASRTPDAASLRKITARTLGIALELMLADDERLTPRRAMGIQDQLHQVQRDLEEWANERLRWDGGRR